MALKDHYRTLGVPASASVQEIKQAFRRLAHKYHPDKNNDHEAAALHFREIQQAYFILSDVRRRKNYDEERYFAGLSAAKTPQRISGEWLLQQVHALNKHLQHLDTYSINHQVLQSYMAQLLSEEHIAVLHLENDSTTVAAILKNGLHAADKLDQKYYLQLLPLFTHLAGSDPELITLIEEHSLRKKNKYKQGRLLPLIIIAIALLLCLLMYYYSKN